MIPADDQDWIDALAGRDGSSDSVDSREAKGLREGILARVSEDVPVAERDDAREDELIARARHAGLIPEREPVTKAKGAPWASFWSGWRVAAALAGLASIVVVAGLVLRPGETPETVRGSREKIVSLVSGDPVALQREILAELRAAGVVATGYDALGKQGIDADLPRPVPPEVRRVLERHGIPPPDDGVLQVEIAARNGE